MERIPELYVTGTHFEVGQAIGERFVDMIQGFMSEDRNLNQKFMPFIQTEKGKELYDGYLTTVQEFYPQYIEELKGMVKATGVPFIKFFALALRSEITSTLQLDDDNAEGCTDIYLKSTEQFLLGHTEDLTRYHEGRVFILHATVYSQPELEERQVLERFTAVTCAGMFPGNTFGYLPDCKLCYTINNLYPVDVGAKKIPRHVVNRALLASRDFASLIRTAECPGVGIANGCCINVCDMNGTPSLWTVEVAPERNASKSNLEKKEFTMSSSNKTEVFPHFNRYKLLKVSEIPSKVISSNARHKRVLQLPVPGDISGLERILGDEEGEEYRIFNHHMGHGTETLFTVIVDLLKAVAFIYPKNPKLGASNTLSLC